jgi:hypothetical protein
VGGSVLCFQSFELSSKDHEYFKEIHIHGSILFERDVKSLHVPQAVMEESLVEVVEF